MKLPRIFDGIYEMGQVLPIEHTELQLTKKYVLGKTRSGRLIIGNVTMNADDHEIKMYNIRIVDAPQ